MVKQVISMFHECAYLSIYQLEVLHNVFRGNLDTVPDYLALLPELSSSGFLILQGITRFTTLPFLPECCGQFDWLLCNSQFHSEFSLKFFLCVSAALLL